MATTPLYTLPSSASAVTAVPPEIPGAQQIFGPPADPSLDPYGLWGVNRAAATENFPNNGLQVYIENWARMGVGDRVSLRLNGTEVNSELIQPGEVDQRVTTFIPFSNLDAEPPRNTLYYALRRVGQVEESSVPISLYVKLERPGGRDEDGSIPGHTELKFSLPRDIVQDGVDAEAARAGVPITVDPYPNMAWRDIIKVSWGGHFIFHEVTKQEVGNAVTVTADESTITAAGDSGANGLAVTYEVYDLVENRSEDWAKEVRITVDAGNSRLDAPFVKEAVSGTVDLDKLGNNPATVQVVARSRRAVGTLSANEQKEEERKAKQEEDLIVATMTPASLGRANLEQVMKTNAQYADGDQIIVRLQGTTLEGFAVDYEAEPVNFDFGHIYEIPVENQIIRSLAKTQVVFSYRVRHQDGTVLKSKGEFIQIVGEPVRLAAPIAKDLVQGALDPDLAATTIEIPWDDSMEQGDVIIMRWIGKRPDHTVYDPELPVRIISRVDAQNQRPLSITVPGQHLKTIEGGTLELYYQLEKEINGVTVLRESIHLPLISVGEPRAELQAPIVSDVADGVMDPDLESATLTVEPYRGMAVGDEVFRQWEGSKTGPDPQPDSIRVTTRLLDKPLTFYIDGVDFIKPNEGGDVAASYWVIRAPGNTRSDSNLTTFSVGAPVPLDPPTISSITDSNGEVLPGGATSDKSLTVTGQAAPEREVEIFDGVTSKGIVQADANGLWTAPLNALEEGQHAIRAKARYGDQAASAVREFSVVTLVAPAITSAKETNGAEIPEGQTWVAVDVTVTGTAVPDMEVEIFDDATSTGIVKANATGVWTKDLPNLRFGPHSITAVAQYGDNPVSPARTFELIQGVMPTIETVTDSDGSSIPDNGSTTDTVVTLTGRGNSGRIVEILDNGAQLFRLTPNSSNTWTTTITALAPGRHAFKARAEYSDKPESAIRTLTVVKISAVTIASVKDTKGADIPDGGTTVDTAVTIAGTVTYS